MINMKLTVFVIALFTFGQYSESCTSEQEKECNSIPNCLCPSLSAPNGLNISQTPQIVYVTFDDAVNAIINFPLYEELLFRRKNPNGHAITATFYVTHEYNDYNRTNALFRKGHEIALHSITHSTERNYWTSIDKHGWNAEFIGQKEMMSHFASIPENKITGMRAPFLQIGGDNMMEGVHGQLDYDCSRPTLVYSDPGLWPHTLDYPSNFEDCQIRPCPEKQYKGFWNMPLVDWIGDNGQPCAFLDTCLPDPDTVEKVFNLMERNFNRSYYGNKSPFGIFLHSAWLQPPFDAHKQGYIKFLDHLSTLEDVYIVSLQRTVQWLRNPVPLEEIKDFAPWHVEEDPVAPRAYSCRFGPEDTPFDQERYAMFTKPCPRKYPWLGNPLGEDQ